MLRTTGTFRIFCIWLLSSVEEAWSRGVWKVDSGSVDLSWVSKLCEAAQVLPAGGCLCSGNPEGRERVWEEVMIPARQLWVWG